MEHLNVPRGFVTPAYADRAWQDDALELVREYANTHDEFMAEDVRVWAHGARHLRHPTNPRAWGSVITRAKRESIIRATGEYRMTQIPPAHPAPRNVWTRVN